MIVIKLFPRQRAGQREGDAQVFRMALRTLAMASACQKGVVSLVGLQLPSDLLMAFQTACRQPPQSVTCLAGTQPSPSDDFGMRERERPRHRMEHPQVGAQQADHRDTEQKRCFGI